MVTCSNSFPQPLTFDEEKKYLNDFYNGDLEAKNILVERNLRLVAHIVKKYNNYSRESDDLISIGTIGLMKAVASYKDGKGTRLATYAARCIENAIYYWMTRLLSITSLLVFGEKIVTACTF